MVVCRMGYDVAIAIIRGSGARWPTKEIGGRSGEMIANKCHTPLIKQTNNS